VKLSGDIVDQVKTGVDIVAVVSEYFPLKRAGRSFKALCPFHDEKTPSFTVSPERQAFHCFGCGAGGDVIAFVMRKEGLSFPEALRQLARRAGVSLPEADPAAAGRRERLLSLHELAAGFFHWGLISSRLGASARRYLESREISTSSVKSFYLGYAQPSWDGFYRHALGKGYRAEEILAGGLILERDSGGYYDRFRNRLMIPVRDGRGKTIGFGARALDDSTPKYLNSPDTELFHKGRVLFGLDLARPAAAEAGEIILGEGYFDVIRAHQEGIKNMVCSQGTAFTPEQSRLLKRHASRVVTAFDADSAGLEASLKGLDIFLSDSIEVTIAVLPSGEDPDSFIRSAGGEAFRKLAREAVPLLDYKLEILRKRNAGLGDRGRLDTARQMLASIARMESPILREAALDKVAAALGISPGALREEGKLLSSSPAPAPVPEKKADFPAEKNEQNLLRLLILNDKIVKLVEKDIDPEDFTPRLRPLAAKMIELAREEKFPLGRTLPARIRDEGLQELIARWLFEDADAGAGMAEVLDYLAYLKKNALRVRCRELDRAIAAEEKTGGNPGWAQKERLALEHEARTVRGRLKEKYGI